MLEPCGRLLSRMLATRLICAVGLSCAGMSGMGCSLLSDLGPSQCEVDADCGLVGDLPAAAYRCEEGVCVDRGETSECVKNTDCPNGLGMCVGSTCVDLTLDGVACDAIGYDPTREDHLPIGIISPKRVSYGSFSSRSTIEYVLEQVHSGWGDDREGRVMAVVCDGTSVEATKALAEFLERSVGVSILLTEQPAAEIPSTLDDLQLPVITTHESHPALELSARGPDYFHVAGHTTSLVQAFASGFEQLLDHLQQDVYLGPLPADFQVVLLRPNGDLAPNGEEVRDALIDVMVAAGSSAGHLEDLPGPHFPLASGQVPETAVDALKLDRDPDVIVSLHGRNFLLSLDHVESQFPPLEPFYLLDHGGREMESLSNPPPGLAMGYPRRTIGVEHGAIRSRYEDYAQRILSRGPGTFPYARDGLHDGLFMAALVLGEMRRRAAPPWDRPTLRATIGRLDDGSTTIRVFDANSFTAALDAFAVDAPSLRFSGIRGDLNWSDEGVPSWPTRFYCPSRPGGFTVLTVGLEADELSANCW